MRPLSPKGYSELIFKDAAASIRRTGQEFQYQLVIQRAYEEGEEELLADDEDGEAAAESLGSEKDEKTFLLDEALHFRSELRDTGEAVFAWRDLGGDPGDLYQFVCDNSTQAGTVASFEFAAAQCQYERKYRKPGTQASEKDLEEFAFQDDGIIPVASPIASPTRSPALSPSHSFHLPARTSPGSSGSPGSMARLTDKGKDKTPTKEQKQQPTIAPPSAARREGEEVLAHATAELHLFDFPSGAFIMQDEHVEVKVFGIGKWNYWMQITGSKRDWLGQAIVTDLSPVFNFEYLSFIFNHYVEGEDGTQDAYSWLLRFKDKETLENVQTGVMQALWQHHNEQQWGKVKDKEKEYVLEAFQDLTMEDADNEEEDEEEDEEDEDEGQRSEHYDSDESEDDVGVPDDDGNVNSQLAVGYKHGRSFVVRGSKIGVFKQNDRGGLEFATNISKVQTPGSKGKLFNPNKVMLHAQDQNLILQNPDNPYSLYRMDLERGQVVDEWKVSDDITVRNFAPESVSYFNSSSLVSCC